LVRETLTSPAPGVPQAATGNGGGTNEAKLEMEEIAGSLEDVARLLRFSGLSALVRNETDPFNRRVLSVIIDHLATRSPG
jgi:hypothetical protein